MTLIKKVEMYHKTKGKCYVDIQIHKRKNSEFETHIILFEGKRITPFENKIRATFSYTLNGLFIMTYGPYVELIPPGQRRPITDYIEKG